MAVANRELMRAINRFAIFHAIRDAGTISRVDLARRTGLSQATVTGITAELLREGMLLEQASGKSDGGRRPVPLALNPEGAYTVGVHLSVDHICVVLMDLQARIQKTHTLALEPGNYAAEGVVEILIEAVQTCLWQADFTKKQISGIGVAIPGLIDSRTGFVHYVPNYTWNNIGLADRLRERMGVAVYVENSANTLAIFEQWFGIGRGTDNFLLITTEHGIGAGLVLDGKLYRGGRGVAGEFGHTVVDHKGPLCRCGQKGCLEAICGNNAILREAKELIRRGQWKMDGSEPTIEEVLAEAKGGNAALRAIYQRAGQTLGIGVGNLCKLFDPEKIIITGKGVLAGELLFGPMRETLPPDISFARDARIRLHIQEWQSTLYARGAGALVLQEVYQSPANRVVPII
ncbi:MAG: ROK family transcriptional regulator [Proteobacteria bacterium]|nr:ROK family transcriptional regulator [Pseudomonadota bacterium]